VNKITNKKCEKQHGKARLEWGEGIETYTSMVKQRVKTMHTASMEGMAKRRMDLKNPNPPSAIMEPTRTCVRFRYE
jgi:hypothetical protein